MSRAFIKEDSDDDFLPERPHPSGPNYVTPRGLDLLRKKVQSLQSHSTERSKEELRDLRYWQTRLGDAILVDNSRNPPEDIRFGARVEAKDAKGGLHRFYIVGQDEAEENGDKIAWDSVPARSLIGHRPGDKMVLAGSEQELEIEITSLRYI